MGDRAVAALLGVACGGTDADAQPGKVLGAEMLDGAAQAVVAAGTARGPQTQPPQGQIHVVHQHQQLLRGEAIPIKRGADRTTALIHVGLGHQQPQPLFTSADLSQLALQTGLLAAGHTGRSRQLLQHHEADVVAGVGVAISGIAKSNQQL
jgi:hypothetical protein